MHSFLSWHPSIILALALVAPLTATAQDGTLPLGEDGRPLNLDFETGTLQDWTAEGSAFAGQPVQGDTVAARRSDMKSGHAGKYWVGTYERAGDPPQGTLTSKPFKLTQPFAKFLVAGGAHRETRVEIVRHDSNKVVFQVPGDETEDLKPVVVDLTPHLGKLLFVRLVDQHGGGWGHINFDDFKLYATRPTLPPGARPLAPDAFAHEGLSPRDAAAAMTVPPGFKVTLFAGEPDVVQPIAFAIDDRGRLWVAEAYSYPVRVPEERASDRILIFEDTDGDGTFDTRKVFTDKLNLVSGLELGFGGVWVGAAPNFLFIPDKDHDDRPDGPPQVLLDGWGSHDTHETLNSFIWGPDGWLYGCHGVFTDSRVGKPGAPDAERTPVNAGIWRYHPTRHTFEVFAHGTSNPWGLDFDEHGQAFLTSCVIPHLYHVIQGGRYERQAGPHFNPYTYDDIKTIADHRHYLGGNPHGGNGRSDLAGGGHAHAGALIYQGGTWPEEYRGSIFMNNIHGARINRDLLVPQGSGFVGKHAPDFLLANDRWSQILSLKSGPDGNVYMIDWYDKNQCHHGNVDGHDRTNGRIFKVSYGDAKPAKLDLQKLSSNELVGLQAHPNVWYARHARRILQERGRDQVNTQLLEKLATTHADERIRLRALWALHSIGASLDRLWDLDRSQPNTFLRAWLVQLTMENPSAKRPGPTSLATMANSDGSPIVRLYLAAALQRMPLDRRWDVLSALVGHSQDAADHNLPLMYWYAAEPLATVDASRALTLAASSKIPILLPFMARRIAAIGTPEAIGLLVDRLRQTGESAGQIALLEGLNDALKGRRQVAMPKSWPDAAQRLRTSHDPRVRSAADALGLTFGDPEALAVLRERLLDRRTDARLRRDALVALLKVHDPKLGTALLSLLDDATVRGEAMRGLAAYDEPKTPEAVLAVYPKLTVEERRDALNTLASRVDFARALLAAVGDGRVMSNQLSADVIRQLRNHRNKELDDLIGRVWGKARETPAERAALIARYKKLLTAKPAQPPDVALGRAMFVKTCQQCHTLFDLGGRVGPDLTGSNRADLDYLLANVLDPSALIGKDYAATVVSTSQGRVLTGIVRSEDRDSVTLVSANDIVVIPKGEIDERRASDQSMMPDDLWKPLADHEVRSLVAYLASPRQAPLLATSDNAAGFYNGRDLTGWEGNHTLWAVEGGEIVGKTKGLSHNDFLRSTMVAGDFRLTLQVKLVRNEGNSGVQFRSEALPNGEMKGYQADVGAGWWGKLYEENGRGLLWPKSGEDAVKPGEWNRYEITAVGSKVRTSLNGKPCAELDDPSGAKRGVFAFQLHSGGPTEVRFRDIRLEVLAPTDSQPMP
ncbi:MAG: DUF1080 domain-containing protein [Isosphaeraceae bacterium]|nr:DUF1080 domain-containing protein [Isosphaeraceae bacterium]